MRRARAASDATRSVRIDIMILPELLAKIKLASVDRTFGGMIYGEQSRIINEALRQYFERSEKCTVPKQ